MGRAEETSEDGAGKKKILREKIRFVWLCGWTTFLL
jgi:hypothetical protein